ncbi:MAG: hypothetical protein ACI9IO_000221 [Cyanobium sp.]|jgi:hypothetical protein|nr:DUF2283 domain-containing protein [Synechococcus sp. CS-1331]
MKIRYFPDTDTPYIVLADRLSSSSAAVSDGQRRSPSLLEEKWSRLAAWR